jgi:predicted DNA-binding transcriptional regulator AlpA
MLPDVHHLVGPREVAKMLGVSRQRVTQLAARPDFPRPTVVLEMGKVWHTDEIRRWADLNGRPLKQI